MKPKLYRFVNSNEKNKFLNYYIELGSISKAAEKTGVTRQAHYLWLENDRYAAAFAQARKMAGDLLEEEARRRAVDGVDEPVYYQGRKCGTVRKYSDALLTLLLKGAKPEVYKDRVETESIGDGSSEISWEGDGGHDEGTEKDKDTV